jgi:chemotaxis regulatin CheY-phosphate phosphatase CheZ
MSIMGSNDKLLEQQIRARKAILLDNIGRLQRELQEDLKEFEALNERLIEIYKMRVRGGGYGES